MGKLLLLLLVLVGVITSANLTLDKIPLGGSLLIETVYAQEEQEECDDSFVGGKGRSCTLAERIADEDGFVYLSWKATRTIINVVLILALLLISFSNITRISIDTYTLKKALPNLLIGVILANASMFIIRFLADISTVTIHLFVGLANKADFGSFIEGIINIVGISTLLGALNATSDFAVLSIPFIILMIGIVVVIGMLWLALILYIRLAAIYILTIVAPIAFVAYGIPGMDKYFKSWWQQFIKWLFMLPAMAAIFWIMIVIGTTEGNDSPSLMRVIIIYVLFFFALTIPKRFGGTVIDKATNLFKKAGVGAAKGTYALTQRGGANIGARGRDMAEKAKLLQASEEESVRKKGDKLAKRAKRHQTFGNLLTKPTSLIEGIKAKQEEKARKAGIFLKTTSLYNKIAGESAELQAALKITAENNKGLSGVELQESLEDKEEAVAAIKKLDPALRKRVLSANQNIQTTAILGLRGEEDGLDKTISVFKYGEAAKTIQDAFRESRRVVRTGMKNSADEWLGGVKIPPQDPDDKTASRSPWKFPIPDTKDPKDKGGGKGMGDVQFNTLRPEQVDRVAQLHVSGLNEARIRETLSKEIGVLADDIADDVAKVFEKLEVDATLKSSNIKLHFDNFSGGGLTNEQLRGIHKEGAQLSDHISEQLANVKDDIDTAEGKAREILVSSSAQNLLKNAGAPSGVGILKGESNVERAQDLQRIATEVSRAAGAVVNNKNVEVPIKIDLHSQRAGVELHNLTEEIRPEEQADFIDKNPEANQIINNYVSRTTQASNVTLSPESMTALSKSVKENMIEGLTSKQTLKRMFNSNAFQDKITELISAQPVQVETVSGTEQPPPPEAPPPAPDAPADPASETSNQPPPPQQ